MSDKPVETECQLTPPPTWKGKPPATLPVIHPGEGRMEWLTRRGSRYRMVTLIVGPWSTAKLRLAEIADMLPATQHRTRPFEYAGEYWLEIWPPGTTFHSPGVTRAKLPARANLPPLEWLESPNQSARTEKISGIVWHETEGSFNGAVSWLANTASQVSAHIVISEDGKRAVQLVAYGAKAWHAVNANSHTIGIELAGFTAQPNDPYQLKVAARIGATIGRMYGIPPTDATPHGYGGHITHRRLGPYGGSHFDPGGFDFEALVKAIRTETEAGSLPSRYGKL